MNFFLRICPCLALAALASCSSLSDSVRTEAPTLRSIESDKGIARPPFTFSASDEALLDEVQRGAFRFLWEVNDPATGMVLDRTSGPHVSVAGVGFQLAAIPAAIERKWITREAGKARVLQIAHVLAAHPEIQIDGIFSHFIDSRTGSLLKDAPESVASTADSALLFGGMIVAAQYFGTDVAAILDPLLERVNWRAFAAPDTAQPWERGFISLGKRLESTAKGGRTGELLPYYWVDAGCEHRLVTFLATGSARTENAVSPEIYYTLRRPLGDGGNAGPLVYFPFSGALFTSQFSHCFMNYAKWGTDNPAAHAVANRRAVDWWENSRRHTLYHHQRSQNAGIRGMGPHAWGFTASDCEAGYQVPGLYPQRIAEDGETPEFDYSTFIPKEDFGDGTIASYAAGTAIMFDPTLAVDALRHYRTLKLSDGRSIWSSPAIALDSGGGFGLADAFRESTAKRGAWIAKDHLAVDQGPLFVAIENARTGLVWNLFESHNYIKRAKDRLGIPD